jgi:hypothetical protein
LAKSEEFVINDDTAAAAETDDGAAAAEAEQTFLCLFSAACVLKLFEHKLQLK